MTLSSLVRDDKGNFLSVMSIDFGIENLINSVFSQQDQTDQKGFNQYNVLLHENHNVFYHKFYDNKSGVLKRWEDIEFGPQFNYTQLEKENFKKLIDNSVQFMKTKNYSIQGYYNIENLFQYWTRNGEKYVSLIYPIQMNTQLDKLALDERETYSSSILLCAKVSQDYRDQLKLFKVFDNNALIIPFIVEAILLGLFIIIFLIHYGILQVKQVYVPIVLLTKFLQKTLRQQLLAACYQRNLKQESQQIDQSNLIKRSPQQTFRQSQQSKTTARSNVLLLSDSPKRNNQKKKTNLFQIDSPLPKRDRKKLQLSPFKPKIGVLEMQESQNQNEMFESGDKLALNTQQNQLDTPKNLILLRNTALSTIPNVEDTQRPNQPLGLIQIRKNLISLVSENPEGEEDSKGYEFSNRPSPALTTNRLEERDQNTQNIKTNWETVNFKVEKRKFPNNDEEQTEKQNRDTFQLSQSKIQRNKSDKKINLNNEKYQSKDTLSQRNNTSIQREQKSESIGTFRRTKNSSIQYSIASVKEELREENIGQIQPMFKEMGVIKETFEQLESVINYAISSTQNHQDFTQTLFHFANAKTTFQRISNINGLHRCYFNLGTLSLLLGSYEQSIEELNASVITSLIGHGIDSLDDFISSLDRGIICYRDDQLFLFSKKLFSLSYSYKQMAFSYDLDENSLPSIKMQEQKVLLSKSLEFLQIVARIIQIKPSIFKTIYRLMTIIEFAELNLLFDNMEIVQNYLIKFDQTLEKQSDSQQFTIYRQSSLKKKVTTKFQDRDLFIRKKRMTLDQLSLNLQLEDDSSDKLISSLVIKSYFLTGQMQFKKGLIKEACENFTFCIEEGKIYDPYIRQASLVYLNQIFVSQNIYSQQIQQMMYHTKSQREPCDFIILLDQSSSAYSHINDQLCIIKYLWDIQFFKNLEDRFMFMSYGEQINIIQNLNCIQNNRQWEICLENIQQNYHTQGKSLNRDLQTQSEQELLESQLKVSLSEALIAALLNFEDGQKMYFNQSQENNYQRNKIIISFSIQNINSLELFFDELFTDQQKSFINEKIPIRPDIHHLILQENDTQNFDFLFNDQLQNQNNYENCSSEAYPNFNVYLKENQLFQSLFHKRDFQKNSKHSLFLSFISHEG